VHHQRAGRHRGLLWLVAVPLFGAIAASGISCTADRPPVETPPPRQASAAAVHEFCGACHAYPPPDSFPRRAWKDEVERGYKFFTDAKLKAEMTLQAPPIGEVIAYYEARAPQELPPLVVRKADTPVPVRFERASFPGAAADQPPTISNVNLVKLFSKDRFEVLATEMRTGEVLLLKPYEPKPAWQTLARLSNPAHTQVIDLDRDGHLDILVADLGNFQPTDERRGSVVWLRGGPDGRFTPITLLKGVGRVADVRAADFNGDGKLDLVVAVFGWQTTGEILLLENQTTDWDRPVFKTHVLDRRHGTIHVPVADLNKDGKPDFVALISQEHETVVAFLNESAGGKIRFRKETIYEAPHPAYGSSGIQLVDLDGDGDLDVLYTNGDVLDSPHLLKPYHGVQWLENKGKFPFTHHPIGAMYGVHRAIAADFSGKGRLDVVAVSYLPADHFPQRKEMNLDSVVLFEQVARGKFARHTLATQSCDHVTCAAADLDGKGRQDLVTAAFTRTVTPEALTIWRNLGPPPGRP
jgi:hypothetical protein